MKAEILPAVEKRRRKSGATTETQIAANAASLAKSWS
jgi:hypothetical protein